MYNDDIASYYILNCYMGGIWWGIVPLTGVVYTDIAIIATIGGK